jgi:hypothetical protein
LGKVELGNPRVQVFLLQLLRQELAPLYQWAAAHSMETGIPDKGGHQA